MDNQKESNLLNSFNQMNLPNQMDQLNYIQREPVQLQPQPQLHPQTQSQPQPQNLFQNQTQNQPQSPYQFTQPNPNPIPIPNPNFNQSNFNHRDSNQREPNQQTNFNQMTNRNYENQLRIIPLKYKLLYQVDILKTHGVGVGLFVEYLDVLKNKYPSQYNILHQIVNNIDRNYAMFIYNLQDENLIRELLLFFPN
jgi:hypothetical protein